MMNKLLGPVLYFPFLTFDSIKRSVVFNVIEYSRDNQMTKMDMTWVWDPNKEVVLSWVYGW